MGDKMTCPICDSHTSAIASAFCGDEDCPYCGASHELMNSHLKIQNEKVNYERLKADKKLILENQRLKVELAQEKEYKIQFENLMSKMACDFDELYEIFDNRHSILKKAGED